MALRVHAGSSDKLGPFRISATARRSGLQNLKGLCEGTVQRAHRCFIALTWRLLCSSFFVMTRFIGDCNILPKKELHRSLEGCSAFANLTWALEPRSRAADLLSKRVLRIRAAYCGKGYIWMGGRMYQCGCVYIHIYMSIYRHLHMCMYTYIYIHIHTHMHTSVCVYIYIDICPCACVYIHIHIRRRGHAMMWKTYHRERQVRQGPALDSRCLWC